MHQQQIATKRILALDYLRGLSAFGIMVYHMHLFSFGESDANGILAKIKIYAIAIFFVISGTALYEANANSLKPTISSVKIFYLKRFFRIFPLLWLATALTYLLTYRQEMFSLNHLIANITILPGIVKPEAFEANGAWSIGNELFFYLCFPLIVFLQQKNRWYLAIIGSLSFVVFCLFTFKLLTTMLTLGHQWSVYVNPLNHFFYFIVGICISILNSKYAMHKLVPYLLIACLVGVFLYPINGEPIVLVTGPSRLFFALLTITICFCFYNYTFSFLPLLIKKYLLYLGNNSYAIYLLHPLVYIVVSKTFASFMSVNLYIIIIISIGVTLLISNFFYKHFECYFINLGKSIIKKIV